MEGPLGLFGRLVYLVYSVYSVVWFISGNIVSLSGFSVGNTARKAETLKHRNTETLYSVSFYNIKKMGSWIFPDQGTFISPKIFYCQGKFREITM